MQAIPSFARRSAGRSLPLLLAVVAVLGLVGWRLAGRVQAQTDLRDQTDRLAQPVVAVITPSRAAAPDEIVLPGNVRAWADAPLYARTSGYLKRRLVDIGQPVKAGQLLAEIDAPELDQQLRQGEADLASAEANAQIARGTAERYRQLLASSSVAPQEAEDRIGESVARAATVASARANVQRLRELAGFKRVLAPFDGTVTARNVDVGALVVAGGASGQALFQVSSTHKLRVYVDVPEALAGAIVAGRTAEVFVASAPRVPQVARIVANATAITPASRTLLTQLELDNPAGALLPGAFAEVHFKLAARGDVLRLPANALLFRADGLNVATVDGDSRIVLKPVTQGRDFGKEIEIVGGLDAADRVIVNPSDSTSAGTLVRIAQATADAAPAGAGKDGNAGGAGSAGSAK